MMALTSEAPDFQLLDAVSGEEKSLRELTSDKGTLIMFICNHCPYVIYLFRDLVDMANEYMAKGINVVAISSNDVVNYPDDSPEKMNIVARVLQFPFPYLYDEDQSVAKAYDAACTPDFYLFDGDNKLVYRGQYDDARPGNDKLITGKDLKTAMDQLLAGAAITDKQYPSGGCNIKWKK